MAAHSVCRSVSDRDRGAVAALHVPDEGHAPGDGECVIKP